MKYCIKKLPGHSTENEAITQVKGSEWAWLSVIWALRLAFEIQG